MDIMFLKGVGEKRAALYHKLGINTVLDLVYHLPRNYIDLSTPFTIDQAPIGEFCVVKATVTRKHMELRIRGGLSLFKVDVFDGDSTMLLTFFNTKFMVEQMTIGKEYLFYGKIADQLTGREMAAPLVFLVDSISQFSAIYPLTAGISSKMISTNVRQALLVLTEVPVHEKLQDSLPDSLRAVYQMPDIQTALQLIHFPKTYEDVSRARNRFIFEELFIFSISMQILRQTSRKARAVPIPKQDYSCFLKSLSFTPTNAQLRSIQQVMEDLAKTVPMNRLVQGDVGSGKTLVAAVAAFVVAKNKMQSALMVPTEILATQHYQNFVRFFQNFNINVGLLVGSMSAKQKHEIKVKLLDGSIDLCIGTHALLSKGVDFKNLSLVITDEQHRFGVAQRAKLQQKGENTHVLVMSATPIPRTLALMVYGELDLSLIDELPPGRQTIKTYRINSKKRERAFGFIKKQLDAGKQAYIVCPLVEQGEFITDLKPAVEYAEMLAKEPFSDYRVGLLHGRLKATEKDSVMQQFKEGSIDLLVSTTVVEVGVDVPNAVLIMIENAERFGLSALHQLRGRVGRDRYESHCILLTDSKNPDTLARLDMLCHSSNGFEIAEFDLKSRGPGNFLGENQHGLPRMKIADLATDTQVLEQAQQAAEEIINSDNQLLLPEHKPLLQAVSTLLHQIGERPN